MTYFIKRKKIQLSSRFFISKYPSEIKTDLKQKSKKLVIQSQNSIRHNCLPFFFPFLLQITHLVLLYSCTNTWVYCRVEEKRRQSNLKNNIGVVQGSPVILFQLFYYLGFLSTLFCTPKELFYLRCRLLKYRVERLICTPISGFILQK